MEGSARRNVQVRTAWMGGDDEILVGSNGIPRRNIRYGNTRVAEDPNKTYQHMRKESKVNPSAILPYKPFITR